MKKAFRTTSLLFLISLCVIIDINAQSEEPAEYVQYYFVELFQSKPSEKVNDQDIKKAQAGHLANIRKLANEKKLLLAGPFADGGGLFILNAKTEEEAKKWVDNDPAIKIGLFTYKIRLWITEKGLLTLEKEGS